MGRLSPTWSGGIHSYPDQHSKQLVFASTSSQQSSRSLDYHDINIDKEHPLGSGSYGAVYLAHCDQLTCAAKVLHRALSSPEDEGSEVAMQKFLEECQLLSMIRHPNIVQYLTTTFDRDNPRQPILLMELCDENLTKLLEREPVPYHEQLNICFDISLALAHLHQNGLYHRDLSSNNVLLKRGQAKVTDFGMSKLAEFQPTTLCPGNPIYMPPEALKEPPNYTDRIDVFSFGVLLVQIMTRKFPDPSNRYTVERVPPSDQFPDGEIHRLVPEVVRRNNHIKLVGSHPLRQVALECLRDKEVQRPSAKQLSSDFRSMKSGKTFTQSQTLHQRSKTEPHGALQENLTEIKRKYRDAEDSLRQQLRATEMKLEQAAKQIDSFEDTRNTLALLQRQNRIAEEQKRECERELEKLRQQAREQEELLAVFQKMVDTLNDEKRRSEEKVAELRREVKEKDMAIEERDMRLFDLESRVRVLERAGQQGTMGGGRGGGGGGEGGARDLSMLRWEVIESTPVNLSACSAVAIGDEVYVASDTTRTVYWYNSVRKWTALPECRCELFSLAVVNDTLVTVGGYDGEYTNKLYSYVSQTRQWSEELPAAPTARREPITLSTAQYLIVAGGFSGVKSLDTVEVMTIADRKWTTCASPLPHLVSGGSMMLCDNQLYLAPHDVDSVNTRQMILTCPLSEIFKTPKKKMFGRYSGPWQKSRDLPIPQCSVVSMNGQLVAIGGNDNQNGPTYTANTVWEFNPVAGSWKVVSHMNVGRWAAIVTPLPGNRLIVVGGQSNWKKVNTVELASL